MPNLLLPIGHIFGPQTTKAPPPVVTTHSSSGISNTSIVLSEQKVIPLFARVHKNM